jgi:hypothetical protein
MIRLEWSQTVLLLASCLPVALLLVACSRSASGDRLLPGRVGEWRAASEVESYDTETIFGYIDGHAEVYMAYGFERCLSRRYLGPGGGTEIVVDLFEMATSDDAFGVFTHDLDGEPATIGHDGLYRYGWLSFWKGRWFVSVYAADETDASRSGVFELGRAVAGRIEDEADRPALVRRLPDDGLDRESVRFLRSEQILRTHLYLGEDPIFGLGPDTAAVLARFKRDDWSAHAAVVEFPTEDGAVASMSMFADRFLGGSTEGQPVEDRAGRWYGARRDGRRLAAVIAAGSKELAAALLGELTGEGRDD